MGGLQTSSSSPLDIRDRVQNFIEVFYSNERGQHAKVHMLLKNNILQINKWKSALQSLLSLWCFSTAQMETLKLMMARFVPDEHTFNTQEELKVKYLSRSMDYKICGI